MKRLLIIQPEIMPYRVPVYNALASEYEIYVTSSDAGTIDWDKTNMHSHIQTNMYGLFGGRLLYQSGLIRTVNKIKPDLIFTYANFRCISYWILLLYCRIAGYGLYSHLQGPYRNKTAKSIVKILYSIISALSVKVILYTEFSLNMLRGYGVSSRNIVFVANSIVNNSPVKPQEKNFICQGILFIGRLRAGVNLDLLCDAVIELQNEYPMLKCHIIGSGELMDYYVSKYEKDPCIIFYGAVYDQAEISEISKLCAIGCYPGNAGLSVVHYMSMSLPCLVHDRISMHQGPEPSYIIDDYNGRLFHFGNKNDFIRVLDEMLKDPVTLRKYAEAAYRTYENLTNPSYADRLKAVFNSK